MASNIALTIKVDSVNEDWKTVLLVMNQSNGIEHPILVFSTAGIKLPPKGAIAKVEWDDFETEDLEDQEVPAVRKGVESE